MSEQKKSSKRIAEIYERLYGHEFIGTTLKEIRAIIEYLDEQDMAPKEPDNLSKKDFTFIAREIANRSYDGDFNRAMRTKDIMEALINLQVKHEENVLKVAPGLRALFRTGSTQGKEDCMKLEMQVCSLELAKHLKELGVQQESLFYWDAVNKIVTGFSKKDTEAYEVYSAFTVAELGEMLPDEAGSGKTGDGHWFCNWHDSNEADTTLSDNTEADARASMLCYLLEQGIIKPHREKRGL